MLADFKLVIISCEDFLNTVDYRITVPNAEVFVCFCVHGRARTPADVSLNS
jgi:hypothetical protein